MRAIKKTKGTAIRTRLSKRRDFTFDVIITQHNIAHYKNDSFAETSHFYNKKRILHSKLPENRSSFNLVQIYHLTKIRIIKNQP